MLGSQIPDPPEGQLQELIETAKAHNCSKGDYDLRMILQQFGLQKACLLCQAMNNNKPAAVGFVEPVRWTDFS